MAPAYPHLAAPIRLGSRTSRNRIMRLATVTNLGESHGVGDQMLAHYRTVARGGAGTVVTEALRVHRSDGGRHTAMFLYEPAVIPSVRNIHAPSTQGRITLAKSGVTCRVSSAPTAKLNATESPT